MSVLLQHQVRQAHAAEASVVAEILSRGFADDPVIQWLLTDADVRPAYTRAFFDIFTSFTLEHGTVQVTEDHAGASLWVPFDPAAADAESEAIGEDLAAAAGPYIERFGIIGQLMDAAHPVQEAHAYLHFFGTIPERQGTGIGSAMLADQLRKLDEAGLPAYLEATTLRSAALYARHGFRRLDHTIDLPDGPSMYPMWRDPVRK